MQHALATSTAESQVPVPFVLLVTIPSGYEKHSVLTFQLLKFTSKILVNPDITVEEFLIQQKFYRKIPETKKTTTITTTTPTTTTHTTTATTTTTTTTPTLQTPPQRPSRPPVDVACSPIPPTVMDFLMTPVALSRSLNSIPKQILILSQGNQRCCCHLTSQDTSNISSPTLKKAPEVKVKVGENSQKSSNKGTNAFLASCLGWQPDQVVPYIRMTIKNVTQVVCMFLSAERNVKDGSWGNKESLFEIHLEQEGNHSLAILRDIHCT